MTENLISFETAKLAKEKGFVFENMDSNYELGYHSYFKWGSNEKRVFAISHYEKDTRHSDGWSQTGYDAPTQSLLQKWLREVHNIEIDVNSDSQDIYHCTTYTHLTVSKVFFSKVYEQALEKGLYQALLLI